MGLQWDDMLMAVGYCGILWDVHLASPPTEPSHDFSVV